MRLLKSQRVVGATPGCLQTTLLMSGARSTLTTSCHHRRDIRDMVLAIRSGRHPEHVPASRTQREELAAQSAGTAALGNAPAVLRLLLLLRYH